MQENDQLEWQAPEVTVFALSEAEFGGSGPGDGDPLSILS